MRRDAPNGAPQHEVIGCNIKENTSSLVEVLRSIIYLPILTLGIYRLLSLKIFRGGLKSEEPRREK